MRLYVRQFLAPPELVPQIEAIAISAVKYAYYTPVSCPTSC